ETERGCIMYDDMSYAKLHEMLKKKFNMEEDDRINISVSLPSFDSRMEITDNEESPFENIGSSNEERNTLFFNNNHTNTSYFNDDPYVQFEYNAKSNEFVHKNDPNFTKPESSFAFETYDENENEQNDCFDGVDENPQPFLHKLKNFMTFKPDIPETPLYKSKPLISTHYKKDSEVKIGNTFDNKEALDLAVRLKAIQEGYQFVSQRTDPNRKKKPRVSHTYQIDDKGVFEMLFIALGASIHTFLNYLRPLLIIDAAHLKGEYKGTNLIAVGMDGNNQIVLVAFGISKGETGPCWSWWMSVLKECIGDHNNLLFISDRHPAIALVVHNEFPLAFHVV
ncbi:transposase, MuDR, MULE transposase domain protein, partial [Tanacetum coccineum]